MKTVLITGVTGTLGSALAAVYGRRGWRVVGVSRKPEAEPPSGSLRIVANAQQSVDDARALLAEDPDLVLLCAGQIEEEVGAGGLPRVDTTRAIYQINAVFPSLFALAAAEQPRDRRLDVVVVGSIADGSPSCFGPVYHASKIALHYFVTGVGPIAHRAERAPVLPRAAGALRAGPERLLPTPALGLAARQPLRLAAAAGRAPGPTLPLSAPSGSRPGAVPGR